MEPAFTAAVARLPRYPLAETRANVRTLTLLASNEAATPPSLAVEAAVIAAFAKGNRYPDPAALRLRTLLAHRHGVALEQVVVGNGSSDILLALGEVVLNEDSEVVYAWPSFSLYPHMQARAGARGLRVPVDAQARLDLQAMAKATTPATTLIILCNPNNPTSTALPADEISSFVAEAPASTCVLIDEAYCEFNTLNAAHDSLALLAKHPNLVLLRTFSKVYALAGLRCGYALCGSERMAEALTRVRQPFSCSALAQAAASAALVEDISWRVQAVTCSREQMRVGLNSLGIVPADSQANFCWFEVEGDDREIVAALAERGVIVRAGSALGQAGALRVTFGTSKENERFLAALGEILD